jgi:cholesterol transport system auxiliary component
VKGSGVARAWSCLATALALALPSGCALQSAPAPPTRALLTQWATGLPRQSARPAVLLVYPPRSRPLYDTARIVYTTRAHEVGYFRSYEWGETPAQMLQALLLATFRDSGLFRAVVAPPYAGRYAWGLRTEIRELIADFTEQPAAVRLTLDLQLIEGDTGRTVAQREVQVREPLRREAPDEVVRAANEATARALREAALFLLEVAK